MPQPTLKQVLACLLALAVIIGGNAYFALACTPITILPPYGGPPKTCMNCNGTITCY